MHAHNRRHERRQDILSSIKKQFKVTNVVDLSKYEKENKFLEGTGSIVFDHENKIAYASLSPRTDKDLFMNFCITSRFISALTMKLVRKSITQMW